MSSWKECLLGDVVTLKRGYDLPKRARVPGPIPIVSSSGVTGKHDVSKAQPPGVVTGRYGTLGQVFFVDTPFWPLNTTLYVRDFKGNDERFVAYYLESMELERYDGAAAVPGVDRNVLHMVPVRWPSPGIQVKIAAVLAAYDELIENNLRRIEILEEMAQAVYREWFVNFRFPGHEAVDLADLPFGAIPEGCEVRGLFDIADVAFGYAFKSARFSEDDSGEKVVRIRNIPRNASGTFTDEVADDRYRIVDGDILIGMDGDFHTCVWSDGPAMLNQRVTRIRPVGKLPILFLFQALQRPIRYFNSTITGTTVAHLGKRHLETIELLVPPQEVLGACARIFEPILELDRNLRRQNNNLRATRDLLLPKLVSGEIDVSDLDIDTEWLVA